jgi:ribosomal protein S18 acetylase RimI-like enzyme
VEPKIRYATIDDIETIAGFQIKMAIETENLQLDIGTVEKGVKAVFDNPGFGQYFVAENDGEIIASLLTTFEWSDWRNASVWWLQSVYVIPEFRQKGIFRKMYHYVKSLVQNDENVGGIRLYVDRTNTRAQQVYKAAGMNGEHYRVFEWMKNF